MSSNADTHASYLETRSFGSLDGLRALSIAGVLWHHTAFSLGSWPLFNRGFLGVDFFFIISGFLIVTLLLRESRRTGTISLPNFYARRFLRIFPAYWAMLILVACVAYVKPGNSSVDLKRELPYALLYISNFVPMWTMLSITWSLSTEEQFYLVVPGLLKHLPRLLPYVVLPLAYVLVSLPPFGVLPAVHMPEFFRQTTYGPILLGVMLAYALNHPRGWAFLKRTVGQPLSPLFAVGLVALTLSYRGTDISGWPRLAIHGTFLILLTTCVLREDHMLRPILSWAPIRRLGVLSYGIYLYHMLALWPVSKVFERTGIQSKYVLFVGVATLSWLFAEISYRLFEQRLLSLKARFSSG